MQSLEPKHIFGLQSFGVIRFAT